MIRAPAHGRQRLDGAIAWLRLSVILVSGLSLFTPGGEGPSVGLLWGGAVAYAAILVAWRPQRFGSARAWWMVTGFIDWLLISLAIVFGGGLGSDFFVLYFVLVFGAGVRFGLNDAVCAAFAVALAYLALMLLVSADNIAIVPIVLLRMGYLVAFAVGCGLLARETARQTRADLHDEAEQTAIRGVAVALSRELRSPLSAASGLVDILLDPASDPLSTQQRTVLSGVEGNLEHASSLVRNVIAAERLERGEHGFSPELGDLNAAVQEVVRSFARMAEARHIGLVVNLCPSVSLCAFDPGWLDHALRNLVINALEFTPHMGAVRASTVCRGGRFVVEIWNSGAAIAPRLHKRLFKKFVREHESRGIGLGLYVVKQIVDLHGGTIAASNTDDGVAMAISLPSPVGEPSIIPHRAPDDWPLRRRPVLASS